MTEQHLNRAQVRAGFEQVRGEAMTQDVGVGGFGDAGPFGGVAASEPGHVARDRVIAGVPLAAGKQPLRGSAPQAANVLA